MWTYASKLLALQAKTPTDTILLAKDANCDGAKYFGWARNHRHMLQIVYDPSPTQRHFYESTLHDTPCPMFFDIDGKGDASKLTSILEQLMANIQAVNEKFWPGEITFDEDDVYMSESNRAGIISVHVVVRPHVDHVPIIFETPAQLARYYAMLKAHGPTDTLPPEVDMCVARVGLFRLLGSSKLRRGNTPSQPMRMYPRHDFEDDTEYDAWVPDQATFDNRSVTCVPDTHCYFDMTVDDVTTTRAVKLRRLVYGTEEMASDTSDELPWVVTEDTYDDAYSLVQDGLTEAMHYVMDDQTRDIIDIMCNMPNTASNEYSSWIFVGQTLYSTVCASYSTSTYHTLFQRLYNVLWHAFSQRSVFYNYTDCEAKWGTFKPPAHPDTFQGDLGMFCKLLKIDQFRARNLACACIHTNLTLDATWNWVHARIRHKFVIDPAFGLFSLDPVSNMWHLSTRDESPIVNELVSGSVYKVLMTRSDQKQAKVDEDLQREHARIAPNASDAERTAVNKKAAKKANAQIDAFKNFVNRVQNDVTLRRVTKMLTKPGFGSSMDNDPYTITFTNCVYNLITGTHRPIRPEDRVSRSVGYAYSTPTPAQVDEVERVFRDIIYSDSVFEWVMCYLSTCLIGRHHENMVFFTGMPDDPSQNGSNGKSTLMNWVMKAIGDYACRLQGSALSMSDFNAPNAHTSHLVPMLGMRAAYVVEIPADLKLDLDSMIKPVTGGDSIKIRGLCREEVEAVLPVTLFATCNSLPDVQSRDHATWRRLRAVWFRRWFCDEKDRDPNNPLHAPKVDNLHTDDKARSMRMATITILIKYLTKYIDNNMKLPACPEVDQSTADFRESTDTLKDFLGTNFERGTQQENDDLKSWVTFKEMKDIAQRKRFPTGRDRDFRNQVAHYYKLQWHDRVKVRPRNSSEMGYEAQRKRNVMLGVSPIYNDNTVEQ